MVGRLGQERQVKYGSLEGTVTGGYESTSVTRGATMLVSKVSGWKSGNHHASALLRAVSVRPHELTFAAAIDTRNTESTNLKFQAPSDHGSRPLGRQ